MEGLGYWFFLAVMYLLSAFLKKRKQQAPADQNPEIDSEKKPNPFQAEFLQDLFGDMKEYVKEAHDDVSEKFDDFEINEEEVEPVPAHIPVEHDHVVFEDLSDSDSEPIHKEYQFWGEVKTEKHFFSPKLKNRDDIKRAIVLKEILDKPRALRKSIR